MGRKTFDLLGLIAEAEAVTATASCTGAEIAGLNLGSASYLAEITTSAFAGTVDASNNYTFGLEVSDAVGGTYVAVGDVAESVAAETIQIGFTAEQIERLVPGAAFFRVTATKVGTTATGVTYTALISKV